MQYAYNRKFLVLLLDLLLQWIRRSLVASLMLGGMPACPCWRTISGQWLPSHVNGPGNVGGRIHRFGEARSCSHFMRQD